MVVAAFIVSIFAVIVAGLAWRETRRSANAGEAADRRDRIPNLHLTMAGPPTPSDDRAIYRLRNDGPQDLDQVTIWRPRPGGGVTHPIAVTGGQDGWADDEIELGPLRLTEDKLFTLCCGRSINLPEFRVRVRCAAGKDSWIVALKLPSPRMPELTDEEKLRRATTLTAALLEIEHNVATLTGSDWQAIPLEDESIKRAELLLRAHAAERSGPLRDLVGGIKAFRVWIDNHHGTFRGDEIAAGRDPLLGLLSGAVPELESLSAALDTPQASGSRWNS